MCAIIGAVVQDADQTELDLLRRVFIESKIRGMHATGVSYIQGGEIHTVSLPVPADQFPLTFDEWINEDGNLYLIGHCRYSTSDLEYNQPIQVDGISVAHNGVISQELYENWNELYGYNCTTKNDTELLARSLREDINISERWEDASIATVWLEEGVNAVNVYRNGKRPLYLTNREKSVIITSTKDIMKRASGYDAAVEMMMDFKITIDSSLAHSFTNMTVSHHVDYQNIGL